MEVYRVVRFWRSHIVKEIGSQMDVSMSVLRTSRALLPRNIIFLSLVLISVRG
jgi:hypothetical protein